MPVTDGKLCHLVIEAVNNRCDNENTPITQALSLLGKYWLIKHDSDISAEFGTPCHIHYHLIVQVPERHKKGYFIEKICSCFSNCLPEMISANIILRKDLRDNLRYLVHLDDGEKHQYSRLDVLTNDKQTFDNALSDIMTTDQLISIVQNAENKTDIIIKLGLDTYCSLRWVIEDLYKESH